MHSKEQTLEQLQRKLHEMTSTNAQSATMMQELQASYRNLENVSAQRLQALEQKQAEADAARSAQQLKDQEHREQKAESMRLLALSTGLQERLVALTQQLDDCSRAGDQVKNVEYELGRWKEKVATKDNEIEEALRLTEQWKKQVSSLPNGWLALACACGSSLGRGLFSERGTRLCMREPGQILLSFSFLRAVKLSSVLRHHWVPS